MEILRILGVKKHEGILLRPVDTFFFRDHKPFSMGEVSKATGWFPPRPGTVYGALRSAYIHRHSDFSTFYEGKDPEINGGWVHRKRPGTSPSAPYGSMTRREPCFPFP